VRGAGRGGARARSKGSSSPGKTRAGGAPRAAAVRVEARPRLSARAIALLCGAALLGAGALVLATVGRAQMALTAARAAFERQSAAAGFRIASIDLEGASAQSSADILNAAALGRGAPLMTLDLDAVRRRVEAVGWVKSARVIRLLPSTVVIAVQERRLIAVWEHDGHTVVIDASGAPTPEADPAKFPGLPLVVGEGANTAAAAILPAVLSRPRLVRRLVALIRVDGRRWDLRLADGALIQLPARHVQSALIRLDQLDQQARILDLGLARIDLRDPEMVAVRPREATARTVKAGVG